MLPNIEGRARPDAGVASETKYTRVVFLISQIRRDVEAIDYCDSLT